ncbi:hypothetical protein LCGC14_2271420 [marine sediment metagenome]|uniref:Uncharacterized protein n=1 Tax=marine sediment metagenome TaxID=412755 RepID=A0A0F9FS20_9ZZZZ
MIDFKALRHDPAHHLGLGDVRLTIGQQQEIEQVVTDLLAALEELEHLGTHGSAPSFTDWTAFHDKVAQIAHAAILKARPQATSSYLNRPLRTVEQAVRDSEGES